MVGDARGGGQGPLPPLLSSSSQQGVASGGRLRDSLQQNLSFALETVGKETAWTETPSGWASASPAEVERYRGALSVLAEVCRSATARDAALRWEGPPKGNCQKEDGPLRPPALLRHFYRVLCSLCSACLAEMGIDDGLPPEPTSDPIRPSQEASGAPPGGPSSEEWLRYGQSLLEALGAPSPISSSLRQLLLLLYPLTSCLCGSHAASAAAGLLQSPDGIRAFCFLGALAAAAEEDEAKSLPAGAAATPRGTLSEKAAATEPSSSATANSNSRIGSSSTNLSSSSLLLVLLGAYEGPLALPGVAAAARGGPLRGLHRAVQRGAARLLGKAASLPDSATAVLAWLVYHRLSSSSSSGGGGNEGSFSSTNVRHLLALLIASVRNHLRRPLEQRVSALCLREALKEPRMQLALASATHDAALAFVAVGLQSLQAVAALAETASKETLAQAPHDPAAAAAARMRQLAAAAPVSEMLALICASSPAVRDSVAARLDSLPPCMQPTNSTGSSSMSCTPSSQQQQQHPHQQQHNPSQPSPGRGRSSAALSASSLPALLYIAAHGDDLGSAYTSAFLELCVRSQEARNIGRHLSPQQRDEAVAALAANTELLSAASGKSISVKEGLGLRGAACLSLLGALWDSTEGLGAAVETLCVLPLSASGEEAVQQGDISLLLRVLHVSLDLTACTQRHLPRFLRLLQRSAAALAGGPLGNPQRAAEAEEALLLVHKCCALSLPSPWGRLQPLDRVFSRGLSTPEASAATAGCCSVDAAKGQDGRCPLVARLDGLASLTMTSLEGSWMLSCRPLATALADESRRRQLEMRTLQQSREEAENNAAQVAQRLAVTNEAHEMELNRVREAAERRDRLHTAQEERLAEEASKLRRELEAEQTRGRDLVSEFQRLLDAKETAIASLQATLREGRNAQSVDVAEVSRDLQIQTAINVKQKEELSKQEGKLRMLLEKQQQTACSLTLLNGKCKELQDEKAKLEIANEKLQEESEQQFKQLILVMKALAEQQAENEMLKEARLQSKTDGEGDAQLRVQQLEQQLQQITRDHESTSSAASLRLVSLEEKLRAFQAENDTLKLQNRQNESTIEDLERRLRETAEALAGARAATTAKSELVSQMQKELKEKENRLAVISAALRGS